MSDNPITTMRVDKAFAHLDPNKGMGDGIASGFPSIGIRGKVLSLRYRGETYPFTREDDGTPAAYIDIIVVGVNPAVSKAYYPEWEEDSSGGPICTALKGVQFGPDPGVPEPQAKSCGVCPRNEWKTLPSGRQGRECQDHKRLAVLLMPKVTARMLGAPLMEPVYFKIPPGSLTALRSYDDSLKHQGIPFAAVLTRVSFDQQQLFRLSFKALQTLTAREAPLVLPMLESPQTTRILGLQPEIRVVSKPQEIEREETGLLEAFAIKDLKKTVAPPPAAPAPAAPAAPRGRGRPKKEVAAPAANKELDLFAIEEVGENGKAGAAPHDDDEVAALLNQTVSDILNK